MLFLAAGVLTNAVLSVRKDGSYSWVYQTKTNLRRQIINIFVRDGTVAQPISIALIYTEGKPDPKHEDFFIEITGLSTSSEEVVLNNVLSCYNSAIDSPVGRLTLIPVPDQKFVAGKFVRVDFSGVKSGHIECLLDAPIFKESFTTRIIEFENRQSIDGLCSTTELDCSPGRFTAWTLDPNNIGDSDDLEALGGEHQGEGAKSYIAPGGNVRLRWQSVGRTSERDILLVVIGSLIALGAAVALEALRPAVESIIGVGVVRALREILFVPFQRYRTERRRRHSKT